jgi:hypothetical protein
LRRNLMQMLQQPLPQLTTTSAPPQRLVFATPPGLRAHGDRSAPASLTRGGATTGSQLLALDATTPPSVTQSLLHATAVLRAAGQVMDVVAASESTAERTPLPMDPRMAAQQDTLHMKALLEHNTHAIANLSTFVHNVVGESHAQTLHALRRNSEPPAPLPAIAATAVWPPTLTTDPAAVLSPHVAAAQDEESRTLLAQVLLSLL